MKHEVTTLHTKNTLAESLKKLMAQKPLSKITVSEIIADAGLNRKTFYYHFTDITDLLRWVMEQEAVEVVKKFDLMVNYEEAALFVMDYIDANQHMIRCAYDSIGRDGMKQFLCADFIDITHALIVSIEKQQGLVLPEDFRVFLCQFYVEAFAGTLINYFQSPQKIDRSRIVKDLYTIFRYSLPAIISSKGVKPE